MKKIVAILFFFLAFLSSSNSQQQEVINKLRLAQALEDAGEYERAAKLFEELLAVDQSNFVYFEGLRQCYLQLKEYDAAIELGYQRLRNQPGDINVLAGIGSAHSRAGREKDADSIWTLIISQGSKNQGYYRVVANSQLELRLFDKATETYVRGRKEIADPFLFAMELANLYSVMMDYTGATREYLNFIIQNESQLEFILSRIAVYTSKDEGLQAAIRETENLTRSTTKIVFRRVLLWLYMEAQRFDDAFETATVIESQVNSGGSELYSFAEKALKENAWNVSARAYQYVTTKFPSATFIPQAKFGYARSVEGLSFSTDTGETAIQPLPKDQHALPSESLPTFSSTISLYRTLASEYPRSPIAAQALFRVGMILYQRFFDTDGALKMFDSVMILSPTGAMVPQTLSMIGQVHISRGDLQAASKIFTRAVASPYASPPQRIRFQYQLAEIQYFSFRFDSALTLLNSIVQNLSADESNDAIMLIACIVENSATFPKALQDYASVEFLKRQRKFSEALAHIDGIIGAFPSAPLIHQTVLGKAELLIAMKRNTEAVNIYGKFLLDYPKSIYRDRAQFGLADLYDHQLHNRQKAIEAYQSILETYPNSLYGETARKRIRSLRGDVL